MSKGASGGRAPACSSAARRFARRFWRYSLVESTARKQTIAPKSDTKRNGMEWGKKGRKVKRKKPTAEIQSETKPMTCMEAGSSLQLACGFGVSSIALPSECAGLKLPPLLLPTACAPASCEKAVVGRCATEGGHLGTPKVSALAVTVHSRRPLHSFITVSVAPAVSQRSLWL
ncbi:hypothetical protein TYRP_023251 [Tyrophagus putrescentiae]|nr:hypothetical protein TYRP_023251 [Tyrophagus putrescentiae]